VQDQQVLSIDFYIRAPRGEATDRKTLADALRDDYPRLKPNGSSGTSFLFEGMEVDLDHTGNPENHSLCNRVCCHMHGSQTERERERCLRFIDHVCTSLGWFTES
jgi:hypothetical protein